MDLNRLTVENLRLLLLLERHRSLTEAANRLGVSVPTASRMLAKLREAFDDELFVRNASQMSPTGVAAASAPRIERALAGLESVSQGPETFSPGRCRRCFRFMMHEQLLAAHLTEVRARIARLAPDVTLEMRSVSDEGFDRLKTGEIDFLVFPMDDNRHPDVRSAALCEAAFDVLVRKDHPWPRAPRRRRTPRLERAHALRQGPAHDRQLRHARARGARRLDLPRELSAAAHRRLDALRARGRAPAP